MNQPNLSFGDLGSATTNGNQLGSWATGLSNNNLGMQPAMSAGSANVPNVAVAPVAGPTNVQQGSGPGFWSRDGGAGLALGGIQVLGNLWSTFQAHKMAKEQMSFAREQWDTNLENQTQTYNTALEDRIRSRHFTEGKGSGETSAYLDKHSL